MTPQPGPPRIGLAIARWLASADRRAEVEGDLIELWNLRLNAGRSVPRSAFWRDVLSLVVLRGASMPRREASARPRQRGPEMVQDVRYTFRMLRRKPMFGALVVGTLALGMASAIAIFTLCDRILLKPLPYPEPDRIVSIDRAGFDVESGQFVAPVDIASSPEFSSVGMWAVGGANLGTEGTPVRVRAAGVSAGFFAAMGVPTLQGRAFDRSEDLGNASVALIGADLWRTHFGGDPNVVGSTVRLNERPFTIIGVMPQGDTFPDEAEIWLPQSSERQIYGSAFSPRLVARLAPGVTIHDAEAAVARVAQDRQARAPQSPAPDVAPLKDRLVGGVRPTLLFLAALAGLLLTATCANVAALMLSRLRERTLELTLRSALGAGLGRLVRQVLVECFVFGGLGAIAGTLLGIAAIRAISTSVPDLAVMANFSVDARFFAVCAGVVFLSVAPLGAVAAVASTRTHMSAALREGVTNTARFGWFRRVLVAGQVAVALVLLTATSAAVAVVTRLARVDLGFSNDRAAVFDVTLPRARYGDAATTTRVAHDIERSVAGAPGVTAVGLANLAPATSAISLGVPIARVDEAPDASTRSSRVAQIFSATPAYFRAIGIRTVAGRTFAADEDRTSAQVAVLSETAAKLLWGSSQAAIGQRVRCPVTRHLPTAFRQGLSNTDVFEVVGVVADVRLRGAAAALVPQVYVPLSVAPPPGSVAVAVATVSDPAGLLGVVQGQIDAVDPDLPLYNRVLVRDLRSRFLARQRAMLSLSGGFGLVALALCAIGIYGTLSQSVLQQTREIGIRTALGANPIRLQAGVVLSGIQLASAGVVAGVLASGGASQIIARFVSDLDRPSIAAVAMNATLLLGVAFVAAWLPARRAASVDPLVALRTE